MRQQWYFLGKVLITIYPAILLDASRGPIPGPDIKNLLPLGGFMSAHYELKSAAGDQFMFNLKAANGEIILTSESYKSKEGALNGIESVKKNSPHDEQFERKTSKSSQPFFVLKAKNHEVIGKSEMYSSESAMEKGIDSVKKNGPIATLNDLT